MTSATIEELRDLARHSRRTAAWGVLALTGALLLFPIVTLAYELWPASRAWFTFGAFATGGALLVRFAFVAGQERGAFRKVFARVARDVSEEKERTRRVPVAQGPAVAAEPPAAATRHE